MTPLGMHKTRPGPGPARTQLDDLAATLAPQESTAGERLRAVAVELIRRGLDVTVVTYQDASWELEAVLPGAPRAGTVTLDRDATGEGCQLAWDHWTSIAGQAGAGRAADIAAALLHGIAPASAPPPQTAAPARTTTPDPPLPATDPAPVLPGPGPDTLQPRDHHGCHSPGAGAPAGTVPG